MKLLRVFLLVAIFSTTATNAVLGQSYFTPYITSITYQNVGTGTATISLKFYVQASATPVTVNRTLAAGASSSLLVNTSLGLAPMFMGSVVMSANQPVVATLVQSPESLFVKNRLLSNALRSGSTQLFFPTLLKKKFNTTSKFSVQNTSTSNADLTVVIYKADSTEAYNISISGLPAGATKYFVMGDGDGDPGAYIVNAPDNFEGSAIATSSAPLVGTVFELSQTNWQFAARAYEGIGSGANTLYMATALCKSSNLSTAYAVQNVSTSSANVVVTYSNNHTDSLTIPAHGKASFSACTANVAGFTGAAKITSSGGQIAALGKAFYDTPGVSNPNYVTAFLGETQGSTKLAFPYVRYTANATFNNGSRQRTTLAIQNVGTADIPALQVQYYDNAGTAIGIDNFTSPIAPNSKVTSNPTQATGDAAKLLEFGYPPSNPDGGYGGSAIIVASTGSKVIALARVATHDTNTNLDVAEDYNAFQLP